jgi:hypothetical protein
LVVVLVPFAVIGGMGATAATPRSLRSSSTRSRSSRQWLVFAVHVPHGTFIHSAVALLSHHVPARYGRCRIGGGVIASKRPSWNGARATALFTYGAVGVVVLAAVFQTVGTLGRWAQTRAVQQTVARVLQATPADDRVMSADAGAYFYLSGREGVVTPNDPLPVIEDTMRAYGVRWLVLERLARSCPHSSPSWRAPSTQHGSLSRWPSWLLARSPTPRPPRCTPCA